MNDSLTQPVDQTTSETPKPISRLRKSKEQHEKAAKLIASGVPINKALIASGWSKHKANMGKRALTAPLMNAIAAEGVHLQELGRQALADPKAAEHAIAGRLMLNVMQGKDDAVQSVKTLGSHRAINCFVPDTQLGIQVNIGTLDALEDDSLIRTVTVDPK